MVPHLVLLLTAEAQQSQADILGLPWWAWVIALIVVAVLLYLLFRKPASETPPFIEEKSKPPVETRAATSVAFIAEDADSLDDLTIIEGIGPKISAVLHEAGLVTFQKLAETSPQRISEILKAAGIQLFDASTWPEQAALISEAKWDELRALQDKLIAGRRE